jgi:pimeloyl-ACP methyl ester carboxylesterase
VLLLTAVGAALLYVGLVVMLWWFQEHVVFQPPPDRDPSAAVAAARVEYRASDGVSLFAYIVGECRADRTAVLAFHGNADLARWLVPWAARVANETGACVMIPEYRGYDGLHPFPSYTASALDARAALDYLRDTLRVPPSHIVVFGHSLGSAIAAELAAAVPPRALVLQSPFSTARAMAARMFVPGLTLFWQLISRVHFNTIARVRSLASPVWVAHGDRDVIIPVHMGREVFAAAAHKGDLLIVHGAGHNDVADVGGRAYWDWLARAIRDTSASLAGPVTARDAAAERRSAP